ncbi:hypothetical protein LDY77_20030, partial [Serratia marcescens]|uniref:hypothetical protein n=1 Tax=Serratia marcescens TaxID=615 RepID=UPI001CDC37AE
NVQPVKDDCIDRSVILGSVPGSENLFLAGQILFKKMCRFLCLRPRHGGQSTAATTVWKDWIWIWDRQKNLLG